MKTVITTLMLFLTFSTYGQFTFDPTKISTKTDKIVKHIAKINVVMGRAIGVGGMRPEQYDNFMKLKAQASTEELVELTNHPNSTIRCYAFWALSYRDSVDMYPFVLKHITDDEIVSMQFGCIRSGQPVGDFFINITTPGHFDENSAKLDSLQLASIDSILIHTPNNLWAKSHAINRVRPSEDIYPTIRELVKKEKDGQALVKLAQYQKEQDVKLILKSLAKSESEEGSLFFTYQAVSEFPHPDFLPILEKNLYQTLDNTHYRNEWKQLYKAIASYENEKAKELLLIPFSQVKHNHIKKYHIDYVYAALRGYVGIGYDDLLWKLWAEEDRITIDVFEYLLDKNPERAFFLTKLSLTKADQLYGTNMGLISTSYDGPENITALMLELALKQEREFAIKVIEQNILEVNVHLFPTFVTKVIEIKEKSFIEPLFERLEKEDNSYVYLDIVEALISYQDSDINQRILRTRKKNKDLQKGWGGDALEKMLKKNKIK